jgi:hypothetical protein
MLKFLRSLTRGQNVAPAPPQQPAPTALTAQGAEHFDVLAHLSHASGFPRLEWTAVHAWIDALDEPQRAPAWAQAEVAWLLHLRDFLGRGFRVEQQGEALLLSSLEPNVARATLAYMVTTQQRIARFLDGLAQGDSWGHEVLVVFEDEESYYRYASHFYPEMGEFAGSSGMFIHDHCSHFITTKADLSVVEPVIAHEMTHACLSHLPIPAWLNEGLAVNTEQRLSPPPRSDVAATQMHAKHLAYWGPQEIQAFWSGQSWLEPGDANVLSYDLARILVAQFAADWLAFRSFVLSANISDAGQAAAIEHLGLDLGAAVCAMLEKEVSIGACAPWQPQPHAWQEPPQPGAFRQGFG